MGIFTRVKIIEFSNKKDAETKLNQFLSSNPDLCVLVDTEYNWDENFILVEYRTHSNECLELEDEVLCKDVDNDNDDKPSQNIIKRVWNRINTLLNTR